MVKGFWPIKRLQLVGASFRGSATTREAIRSEHLGLLLESGTTGRSAAIKDVAQELCALNWRELVLQDWDWDLDSNRQLLAALANEGFFVRIAELNSSYSISLATKFEDYLSSLSGSARRRLFNKRPVLNSLGVIEIVDISRDDWKYAISVLSDLHKLRWGKPVYSKAQIHFHTTLRDSLGPDKVEVSCLLLDGQPISALHNVTVDGVVYNLQSGFNSGLDSRISPMLLHMGMSIEAAIDNGMQRFHLLAGAGKHTDFKAEISTDTHNLVDIQIIRDKKLAAAYRIYDMLMQKKTRLKDLQDLNLPFNRTDQH